MQRIYHRYEVWECYKSGFFKNVAGEERIKLSKKVLELFNNSDLTREYMNRVINEWFYSCQHNLTNISLNRVAWLGQSACCIYAGIPYQVTMENWRFVYSDKQVIACEIAEKLIKEYETKNQQLCLNFI